MNDTATATIPAAGLDPIAGGDTLSGMALLGKSSAALLVVVAVILLFAWLVRRFNLQQGTAGQQLRVVSSVAVGQRERVVLVEIDNTWLVLGVGGDQVTRLHELPAQTSVTDQHPPAANLTDGFALRLAQVLAHRPSSSSDIQGSSSGGRTSKSGAPSARDDREPSGGSSS